MSAGDSEPRGPLSIEGEAGERLRRRRLGPASTLALVLAVLATVGLMVLAAAGFTPALYLIVAVVVGVVIIAVGARLH